MDFNRIDIKPFPRFQTGEFVKFKWEYVKQREHFDVQPQNGNLVNAITGYTFPADSELFYGAHYNDMNNKMFGFVVTKPPVWNQTYLRMTGYTC